MSGYERVLIAASVMAILTLGSTAAFWPYNPPPISVAINAIPVVFLLSGWGALYWIESAAPNVGPTSRHNDSRSFRAIRKVLGFKMERCGCLYVGRDKPSFESVEDTEYIWERKRKGAKLRYDLRRRRFVRCTRCGHHYGRTDDVRYSKEESREYWNDEIDPYPDDEREVVDTELIDA